MDTTTKESRQQWGATNTPLPKQVHNHLPDGNPRIDGHIISLRGLSCKGKFLESLSYHRERRAGMKPARRCFVDYGRKEDAPVRKTMFLGRINNEEDRTAINRAVSVQLGIIPAEIRSAA